MIRSYLFRNYFYGGNYKKIKNKRNEPALLFFDFFLGGNKSALGSNAGPSHSQITGETIFHSISHSGKTFERCGIRVKALQLYRGQASQGIFRIIRGQTISLQMRYIQLVGEYAKRHGCPNFNFFVQFWRGRFALNLLLINEIRLSAVFEVDIFLFPPLPIWLFQKLLMS